MSPKLLISQGLLAFLIILAPLVGAGVGCGASTQNPKKSNTRVQIAKDYLSRHQLDAARKEATTAIKYNGQNAEAYLVLGLVDILEAGQNNRILEVDDCLTGVDAEALRAEMNEHFESASLNFQKATEIDDEYSEAYANQAKSHALLEEHDEAIRLLTKAIEVPHRLMALGLTRADLGWAKFHLGDDAGAAKELRQALQSNAKMCVAKYRMGRVYFKRKEWNKSLKQFQAVVLDDECRMQEAHLYLVKTMTQLSMTSELPNAIDQCSALAPQSCIAAQCQAGV
ncbi:MAG: tetratricopeptide repeat protein [Myxococcales bacterium]|nr:tetratricopeptide repeat protein [Myxococcales bacterium]